MELLVVIAIIGILSSVVYNSVTGARLKAKQVAALAQLKEFRNAFNSLALDTSFWPGREALAGTPDPQPMDTVRCGAINNEVQDLADPQSGLLVDSPDYPGWKGPYLEVVPKDPWGNNYFFDTNYDIPPTGDNIFGAVIGSYGPNGVGNNLYDGDDIIDILAQTTCP